jgi:hypothetical protein
VEPPPAHPYTVGQRVRSRSPYHAGQVGTVIKVHPTTPRPSYIVEFADGACVFLREAELDPAGADA